MFHYSWRIHIPEEFPIESFHSLEERGTHRVGKPISLFLYKTLAAGGVGLYDPVKPSLYDDRSILRKKSSYSRYPQSKKYPSFSIPERHLRGPRYGKAGNLPASPLR